MPELANMTNLGIDVRDLLDCTSFSRSSMPCSNDASIGTLAQLLDKLVLRIHHEGGVQRGKTVSLHIGLFCGKGQDSRNNDQFDIDLDWYLNATA